MSDFGDRVVMVTGAAGTLGRAVARAFQKAGAHLVLVDRAADRLPRLFPELADSEDHLLATSVDLREPSAIDGAVASAIEALGHVDVLVNAAGGYRGGKMLHETPPEMLDFLFDLNARTTFNACQAAIPHMLEAGRGWIVSVGARASLQGRARMGAQSVSKSAVVRMTETMAAELRRKGINVNCVLPGTIDTPKNREAMPKADQSRWTDPADIADVILFLASEGARAIHGAAIPVFGIS
jgi:NAD(P)-dependent dehydrogenase (short-subunit alcohol dehydrogenase family)